MRDWIDFQIACLKESLSNWAGSVVPIGAGAAMGFLWSTQAESVNDLVLVGGGSLIGLAWRFLVISPSHVSRHRSQVAYEQGRRSYFAELSAEQKVLYEACDHMFNLLRWIGEDGGPGRCTGLNIVCRWASSMLLRAGLASRDNIGATLGAARKPLEEPNNYGFQMNDLWLHTPPKDQCEKAATVIKSTRDYLISSDNVAIGFSLERSWEVSPEEIRRDILKNLMELLHAVHRYQFPDDSEAICSEALGRYLLAVKSLWGSAIHDELAQHIENEKGVRSSSENGHKWTLECASKWVFKNGDRCSIDKALPSAIAVPYSGPKVVQLGAGKGSRSR